MFYFFLVKVSLANRVSKMAIKNVNQNHANSLFLCSHRVTSTVFLSVRFQFVCWVKLNGSCSPIKKKKNEW